MSRAVSSGIGRVIVVLGVILTWLLTPASAAAGGPLVPVAHRGDDGWHRESSMVGYSVLARDRAPWVEADIRWTADGHAVIWHDPALWWSCSGPGAGQPVAALTLATVRATTCEGLPIATLAELVALLVANPATGLFVEPKAGGPHAILAIVEPLRGRTVLESFSTYDLHTARSYSWPACYLGASLPSLIGGARVNRWGCVGPPTSQVTRALVTQARGYGIDVIPFTPNSQADLTAMCQRGARRVFTDYWLRARATMC
jgi:glycerophosphoryl diester phosphodiesterase